MKKQRSELAHLMLFASGFDQFPGWPVCHERPPGPDFTRMTERGLVGIEHTRLLVSSEVHRAREEVLDRILNQARERAEACGVPPLHVFLYPRNVVGLRKRVISDVSERLATLVLENVPEVDGRAELTLHDLRSTSASSLIAGVTVHRLGHVFNSNWQAISVGVVAEDVCALLQLTLDNKDEKLEGYLRLCRECWLLIVAEGHRPSGFVEPNNPSRSKEYDFRFTRAFFMEAPSGSMFELRKSRSAN